MERYLLVALDEDCTISTVLKKDESRALDKYTSETFESSEDIRKKYADKISSFLNDHSKYILECEQKNGRKERGDIVTTELTEVSTSKRVKTLYKKDMRLFKLIIQNKEFMKAINIMDYINVHKAREKDEKYWRIFSEYISREINFHSDSNIYFKRTVSEWLGKIKQSSRYYEIVRLFLKQYKTRYRELKLDSLDVLYSKYLAGQQVELDNIKFEEEVSDAKFEASVRKSIIDQRLNETLESEPDLDREIFPPNPNDEDLYAMRKHEEYLATLHNPDEDLEQDGNEKGGKIKRKSLPGQSQLKMFEE